MEILIVGLLIVIIVLLYQLITKQDKPRKRGPAFTKREWDEAVTDFYGAQFEADMARDLTSKPGWDIWKPPPYEEVKNNPEAIKALREMTRRPL